MTSALLNKQIRDAVFSEMGLKLDEEDPVFAVVLATKMMLTQSGGALQEVVRDIPRAITASIEQIVLAVEDSEKTVGSLRDETKGMLKALSKMEVEETHRRIKEVVVEDLSKSIAEQTKALQAVTTAAELKIKAVSGQLRETKVYASNIVLSAALLLTIGLFGFGLVMMYYELQDTAKASNYWYGKFVQQEKAIDTLPASFKKQVQDRLEKP